MLLSLFIALASEGSPLPIDSSAVIVAIVSVIGTLGAAWFMFRGKTQDTANWLIVELRNQAEAAMKSAEECEVRRAEDHKSIEELRSMVAGLQAGMRKLSRENATLRNTMDSHRDECGC